MPIEIVSQVIFTVSAEGLLLPLAGYRLPPGIYDGSIRRTIRLPRPEFVSKVTIRLTSGPMLQMGIVPVVGEAEEMMLDITGDFASGAIREDPRPSLSSPE
jgi:hypothetical protein